MIELEGLYQICLSPGATKSTFRYNRPPIIDVIGCILQNCAYNFDKILHMYTSYNVTSYERKKSICNGSSFFNIEFNIFSKILKMRYFINPSSDLIEIHTLSVEKNDKDNKDVISGLRQNRK